MKFVSTARADTARIEDLEIGRTPVSNCLQSASKASGPNGRHVLVYCSLSRVASFGSIRLCRTHFCFPLLVPLNQFEGSKQGGEDF